uniref:Cysteine rich protein 1 n=1 Tax=Salvator merianae TaxID=96440 RepID=A0A8D0KPD1_SALMN
QDSLRSPACSSTALLASRSRCSTASGTKAGGVSSFPRAGEGGRLPWLYAALSRLKLLPTRLGSAQLHEAAFKERLSPRRLPAMPKCPRCQKEVYFAEKVTSLGKDWHRPCLKCEKCQKTLTAGGHAEHDGKPYCNHPCYAALFGPKGFGRGGTESHTFK